MAELPAHRLRLFFRPITVTGIDFLGPMTIFMLRRSLKRWDVIFTCLTTKAVHIEMAESLTSDSFLLAFWQFVNVRGCSTVGYSDNGKNLGTGEKEIAELWGKFDQEQIGSELAKLGIEWHFSPPVAHQFGGSWERLIQSEKTALRIILDGRTVANEVLHSVLVGAAALMIGRPLEYVPVYPQGLIPSTLNDVLLLGANPTEPTDHFDPRDKLSSLGWRGAQVLINHFWH